VTALDVGQGDAVLLRAPDGAAVLVDAGPPGSPPRVLAALRRAGVRRLALVVLSHGSLDHVGGLAAVLEHHPVGVLVHPELGAAPRAAQDALAQARRRGTPVRLVAAGAEIRAGAWRLRVLSPLVEARPGADPNPASLVVLASAGGFDALLTADAESRAVLPLAPGPVEVLKVAHHGSADAGLPALLARLRPAAALLSLGAGNAYGHPAPTTLSALAAAGVPVWRTDRSGDVTVAPAAAGVVVRPPG
jgi:competence protein ComEC